MSDTIPEGLACKDCGQPLNESTQHEFVGRPDDFAHHSSSCRPRLVEQLAALRAEKKPVGVLAMKPLVQELSVLAHDHGAKTGILAVADGEGSYHVQVWGTVLEAEGLRSLLNKVVEPIIDGSDARVVTVGHTGANETRRPTVTPLPAAQPAGTSST